MQENIKWTKLTDIKSFETQPQQLIKVNRDEVLIIKDNDDYHALNNRCPHMGLSLNASKCNIKDKTIHCKFHSSSFFYKSGSKKSANFSNKFFIAKYRGKLN